MTYLINYQKPRNRSLLDDFFNDSFMDTFYHCFDTYKGKIPLQVKDNATTITVSAKLAGYTKDQIDIRLEKGYVTISTKVEEKKGDYHLDEFDTHSLTRTLYIGEVMEDKATAVFEEGVLSITFPKSKQLIQKNIPIS